LDLSSTFQESKSRSLEQLILTLSNLTKGLRLGLVDRLRTTKVKIDKPEMNGSSETKDSTFQALMRKSLIPSRDSSSMILMPSCFKLSKHL
jgi:anaerobic glycerol-3-phosphate dehydrogenase